VPAWAALTALYADGKLTTCQVAAALGSAKSTVHRVLTRTGTVPRTRPRPEADDDQPSTYHVGQLPYGTNLAGTAVAGHIGESKGDQEKNDRTWHHTTVARILRRTITS